MVSLVGGWTGLYLPSGSNRSLSLSHPFSFYFSCFPSFFFPLSLSFLPSFTLSSLCLPFCLSFSHSFCLRWIGRGGEPP